MEQNWREWSEALFFVEGKSIREIEQVTGVSRKSLSGHLRSCAAYQKERERRKQEHAEGRKAYQRNWDRKNRLFSSGPITADTMRREHDIAVAILSREKYH